jgi:hypothetical protein
MTMAVMHHTVNVYCTVFREPLWKQTAGRRRRRSKNNISIDFTKTDLEKGGEWKWARNAS